MEQIVIKFFSFFFPVFLVLFASVFVWFALVSRLFNILKTEHPQKYKEMGSPTLIWNNSPKSSWVLMKFIVKKEFRSLNNQKLVKLGNFMFGYFSVYITVFAVLFFTTLIFMMWVALHAAP